MSKYVKNLITDDLKKRLDGVSDALLVNVVGMENEQERRAAEAAAPEEHPPAGGQEQPGPPGHRRDARWRRRSKASRARWPSCGAARTSSRWPRKSSDIAGRQAVRAVRAQGGVMDGQQLVGRRGEAGQQVAEPRRAAQHPGRPDSDPGRDAVGPAARPGQQAGQPDQEEERRRRRQPKLPPSVSSTTSEQSESS